MFEAITKNSLYHLGSLLVGKPITVPSPPYPAASISTTEWTLRPGVYTPRQLVRGFAPLLDTVLYHLAPDPSSPRAARDLLLDNLAANLATDTRESSLTFPEQVTDKGRREIRDQARRIGKHLVQWANEARDSHFEPDLILRSPCEGHLLLPHNVDLMFGRRSKPHLMQLFNEYMHQMILLRDSLLPFHNYEDVLIPVSGKGRGIRDMEGPRAKFLAGLFTKQVTQQSVVAMAREFLAPNLAQATTEGYYGFQYKYGLVLPTLFATGPLPFHLLQYIPAHVYPSHPEILLEYEFPDYYAAPRTEIPKGTATSSLRSFPGATAPQVEKMSLGLRPSHITSPSVGKLDLQLQFDNGQCAMVDIGQIARGHRYAYEAGEPGQVESPSIVHSAGDILFNPEHGLTTAQAGGFHVIPTDDHMVALAVLGKLYPENVVVLSRRDGLEKAVNAGKGFEPKFVVWV
ncbi:hypothetical protein P175DRAFT_0515426 [Aspergillus ochraceoroseus IBT 24754]|uniref:Uncharacterized protein n=2 Tax=Aspergillus ochraceoroseus TaxID=138278 RepID=A0A2T5M4Y1_9EURO|nr:uncharacterized protein P175DRAFT_0515426 [Aspergillus ochraceoroseus IBT 24754]KKK23904.1 hypothetical protein AOCH_004199 [Aspergillus ochraceoroseus]PTU23582.1 hypothetical protein P175DRAFT_0515426 [Aspergillus ochraceoroseus IBT 24754]